MPCIPRIAGCAPFPRFRNGATYPIPCVRLTKAECYVLVDAITDFGQFMPKTTKARKRSWPVCQLRLRLLSGAVHG